MHTHILPKLATLAAALMMNGLIIARSKLSVQRPDDMSTHRRDSARPGQWPQCRCTPREVTILASFPSRFARPRSMKRWDTSTYALLFNTGLETAQFVGPTYAIRPLTVGVKTIYRW
jgi:hypothetical protein